MADRVIVQNAVIDTSVGMNTTQEATIITAVNRAAGRAMDRSKVRSQVRTQVRVTDMVTGTGRDRDRVR